MFGNLIRVEDYKLLRRRMLWIMIALAVLLTLASLIMQYVNAMGAGNPLITSEARQAMQSQAQADITWPTAPAAVVRSAGALSWLLMIVLIGAATAQEYSWHTLHLWLGRGVPRLTILIAKTAALALPALLVVLLPLVGGLLLTAAMTIVRTGSLDLAQVNFGWLVLSTVLTAYAALPYAAFAFLLAVATRTQAAPLGGGMALWVLSLVLVSSKSPAGPFTPIGLAGALETVYAGIARSASAVPAADLVAAFGFAPSGLLGPGAAILGIAAWVVVCVGMAELIFRRQDLTD